MFIYIPTGNANYLFRKGHLQLGSKRSHNSQKGVSTKRIADVVMRHKFIGGRGVKERGLTSREKETINRKYKAVGIVRVRISLAISLSDNSDYIFNPSSMASLSLSVQ